MKDDLDLLRDYAQNGSQEAFRALVNRYIPLVWATAARVMGVNHSIEEVTQDAFLLLAEKAKTLTDKQIDKIMSKLMTRYQKELGAELR